MATVTWSGPAENDLENAIVYLRKHSRPAATRLVTAIDYHCTLLGQFPELGRTRDELAPGMRSVVVEKYILFYKRTEDVIEIVRMLHGRQDAATILKPPAPEE